MKVFMKCAFLLSSLLVHPGHLALYSNRLVLVDLERFSLLVRVWGLIDYITDDGKKTTIQPSIIGLQL